jgi:hypothetical protein
MLADDADAVGDARQHNAGPSSRRHRHAEVPRGARRDPGKHEILYMVFDDSRAAHLCLFVVSEPKPVAGPAARITASCSPEANRRDCTLRLVRETS